MRDKTSRFDHNNSNQWNCNRHSYGEEDHTDKSEKEHIQIQTEEDNCHWNGAGNQPGKDTE